MFRRSFCYAAPFVLVFSTALAQAQTAPAPAAPPATTGPLPVPTNLAPPAAPPGAAGPDAPVSSVTLDLEAKLASMQRGGGLTADQAAQRAVTTSVDVAGKRSSLAASDADVDAATAGYVPKLDLSARYTYLNKFHQGNITFAGMTFSGDLLSPVIPNNYNLQATLTIPLSDYVLRVSNSLASANHSKTAAQFDEQATRLSVARDARVDYYQWVRAQGASYVAAQALEAARGHAADAKNSFDAGLVSRADLLRALSQVKNAELTVAHYANLTAVSTEQLRVAMGDTGETNYDIGENILIEPPPFAVPPTPGAGYAEALEHRLEVKQLGESEASLRDQAKVARAANYPRLDASGDFIYANPNQRYFPPAAAWHDTWDVNVVLSWTPTNIFGAQAQAHAAEAHADEVAAKRASLKNGLRLEVNQAMNALTEATVSLESAREGLVAAEENYRVRRELYRAGKATVVDVTDAETDLTRSRLEVVNAHVDERIARVALTHALGRDVGH
ncbi:MAG TPA: TolC family protein [Polyangiaceae bacterium]|jgi:outer membrane protein|nr:TolC family protein [Polyangiaceae bacterium]